jgi:hypothetical protein
MRRSREPCRTGGGKEYEISLFLTTFSNGVSEKALTCSMAREGAHKHHVGACTQVYHMFLRSDEARVPIIGHVPSAIAKVGARRTGIFEEGPL